MSNIVQHNFKITIITLQDINTWH